LLRSYGVDEFRFYAYDGHGSTRLLFDVHGSVTDSYSYDAFGSLLEHEGTSDNSYMYTGEQFDSDLGQYYLRARYYDQSVGRFSQMDSWQGSDFSPHTLNKYLYGDANPVMNVDPTGNFSMSDVRAVNEIVAKLFKFSVDYGGKKGARQYVKSYMSTSIRSISDLVRKEAKRCLRTRGRKCLLDGVVVAGADNPESQGHIADAITNGTSNALLRTRSSQPISPLVHYKKGAKKSRRWLQGTVECSAKYKQKSKLQCDEFPFHSSEEGGAKRYGMGMVSLRPITASDNHGFGSVVWGGAVKVKGVNPGDSFLIVPYGDVSFFIVKGVFGPSRLR
jgi:RHS repeat-associated protein